MNLELLETFAFFLTGGFLLFLAITITRDNFANRLNRVTGAMLFFAGIAPIFMAMGHVIEQSTPAGTALDESPWYNLYLFWEFFFPTLLLFSWIFPLDRFRQFRHPGLRYLIFIPQIMHIVIIIFFAQIAGFFDALIIDPAAEGFASIILKPLSSVFQWFLYLLGWVRSHHVGIFGAINFIYVGFALYFLETGPRHLTNPRLLSQTGLVLWGMRIGLGLFVLAHLGATFLPYDFPDAVKSSLMILSLLGSAGILIYATIRYQFLDVRLVFRQSFVYTITSAILVGIYIFLAIQSTKVLGDAVGSDSQIVSYVFIVILLLLFQPINNWVEDMVRSMFLRTRTDYGAAMERFSRELISQFEPVKLRKIIDGTLRTTLLVERVYFVLYDDEVEEYAVLPGEDIAKRIVIDRDDLMLRGINLLDTPTYYQSLSEYSRNSRLAELLDEKRIKLILPMKDAQHLLGFLALTDKVAGYRYSSDDINLLGVMSNQMVTALTNARLYVESMERMRLQEEVNMARQIQIGLLPSHPPELTGAVISAHSTPSRTVGGDFYDFIDIGDGRIGILIADASGKGMPAALLIAQIQAIIRSEVNNGNPIDVMMHNMNQQIAESTSSEKYVTLFYGELDTKCGKFSYSNAGHNYPVLVRSNGDVEFLKDGGPIIGALPKMIYTCAEVTLGEDDTLFLFTDGLSEAMDDNETEYGEERIMQFVCNNRLMEPHGLVESILEDVRRYDPTYPPRDDTTIVALKMRNGTKLVQE